jgi:hypothetical protein
MVHSDGDLMIDWVILADLTVLFAAKLQVSD